MSDTATLPNWENLVKKQLKTEDIYPILEKENLEGIEVSLSIQKLKTFGKPAKS
jgi:hypothetical protein